MATSPQSALQKVIIAGIGKESKGGLANWASEATLQEAVKHLAHMSGLKETDVKKSQKSMDNLGASTQYASEKIQKLIDKGFAPALAEFLAALDETEKVTGKSARDTNDIYRKSALDLHRNFDSVNTTSRAMSTSIYKAKDSLADLSSFGKSLFNKTEAMAGLGAIMILAGDILIHAMESLNREFASLYDHGIAVGNGFMDLSHSSMQAGMNLEEFGKFAIKHAELTRSLGMPALSDYAKSTQDVLRKQGYYGLALNQVSEYTADYLEILQKQGRLTTVMDNRQVLASANYIRELTEYSQIAGKSREDIQKEAMKYLTDAKLIMTVPERNKAAFESVMSMFAGMPGKTDEFMTAFGNTVAAIDGQNNDLVNMLRITNPRIAQQFIDLAHSLGGLNGQELSPDQAHAAAQALLTSIRDMTRDTTAEGSKFTQAVAGLGHVSTTPFLHAMSSMSELSRSLNTSNLSGQVKATDEFLRAMTDINNGMHRIYADLDYSLGRVLLNHENLLMSGIEGFASAVQQALNWVDGFIKANPSATIFGVIWHGLSEAMNAAVDAIGAAVARGIQDGIALTLHNSTPDQLAAKHAREDNPALQTAYDNMKNSFDHSNSRWIPSAEYREAARTYMQQANAAGLSKDAVLADIPSTYFQDMATPMYNDIKYLDVASKKPEFQPRDRSGNIQDLRSMDQPWNVPDATTANNITTLAAAASGTTTDDLLKSIRDQLAAIGQPLNRMSNNLNWNGMLSK